jgi:hypothetical protein
MLRKSLSENVLECYILYVMPMFLYLKAEMKIGSLILKMFSGKYDMPFRKR